MINETIRKNINVDADNIFPIFTLKEGDSAKLKVALFKNSVAFDVTDQTIKVGAKTSKGIVEQTTGITISKNNVDIQLKNSALKAGLVEIELEIKDTNGTMTTASFYVTVTPKVLNDGAIEATNEFDTLSKTVDKLEKDYAGLRKVIINENQVVDLQDQINAVNTSLDTKANKSEVDNNINELDVKIAENKSLTDSEISRLKEIANTWETFKNSGGVINGDIKLPRGFALCGTTNGNRDALIYQSNQLSDNGRVIVGSSGQTTQIASELRPEVYWNLHTHHIILDSDYVSNKSINGYTKLPNGLIMQWGTVWTGTETGKKNYKVTYPIHYPNMILYFNAQTQGATYDYSRIKCVYGENNRSEMNIVEEKEAPYGTTIRWFSIGY